MKKWKALFFFCLAILIVTNLLWAYKAIDLGSIIIYSRSTMESQDRVVRILSELLFDTSKEYSKKEILFLLRQKYPEGFVVEEENKLIYEGIHFEFANDSLTFIKETW